MCLRPVVSMRCCCRAAVESGHLAELTGIAFPIEVILRVTVAFQLHPFVVARRAVREWDVVIGDVIEEMEFFLFEQEGGGDGVHRGVAPSFVEEAAVVVERVEVVEVGLGAQPVEVADFEVGPLMMGCCQLRRRGHVVASRDLRNDSGCTWLRRRRSGSPSNCLRRCVRDAPW